MNLKQRFVWPLVAAVAIAGGSFFGAQQLIRPEPALAQAGQNARPTPAPESQTVAPATDLSKAFRAVHESLKDAVVNINVKKRPAGNASRMTVPDFGGMLPPGFEEQLRDQLREQAQRQVSGTGSGVIVSADGYILTNNHVVEDADEVQVTFADGRELTAEVIGTDPKTDLAVVRVKADKLTFAKFGDSDALQTGDWVLAFGSPFGLSQTMTQGIVSAKGRHVPIIASNDPSLRGMTYENFIQTDAAINPGNSGGPLVNLKGEVVGINAAIASNTGAYNGVGFSIPSNDASYIMKSLKEHGKVVRGYLGIGIQDVRNPAPQYEGLVESIRKSGFTGNDGVLVGQVSADGPAAQAGLQAGDIITKVDGKSFKDVDELRNQIARTAPDSKMNLAVFRDGKAMDLAVTVGTQPDSLRPVNQPGIRQRTPAATEARELGARVEDVNANIARRFGLSAERGAVVTSVAPNSVAAKAGLQAGDVVIRVDKTDITSARQFADTMAGIKSGEGVRLLVRTEDGMDRLVFVQKP